MIIDPQWLVHVVLLVAAGVVVGVSITIAVVLAVWRDAETRWRKELMEFVRAEASSVARRTALATPAPSSERSTVELKVGVLPFVERPTLVHDTTRLPGMKPASELVVPVFDPPSQGVQPAVAGNIDPAT